MTFLELESIDRVEGEKTRERLECFPGKRVYKGCFRRKKIETILLSLKMEILMKDYGLMGQKWEEFILKLVPVHITMNGNMREEMIMESENSQMLNYMKGLL